MTALVYEFRSSLGAAVGPASVGLGRLRLAHTARRSTLLLKALSFCAICLALAEPTLTLLETKTGLVVLVDTSKSVTPEDLSRASSLAGRIESRRGNNWVKIVPFAAAVRDLSRSRS